MLFPLGAGDRHLDPGPGRLVRVLRVPAGGTGAVRRSPGQRAAGGAAALVTRLALGRRVIVPPSPPELHARSQFPRSRLGTESGGGQRSGPGWASPAPSSQIKSASGRLIARQPVSGGWLGQDRAAGGP